MNEQKLAWFLHERGYNFMSIPKITYPEIYMLTDEHNRIEKEKEKQQKKAKRKRR